MEAGQEHADRRHAPWRDRGSRDGRGLQESCLAPSSHSRDSSPEPDRGLQPLPHHESALPWGPQEFPDNTVYRSSLQGVHLWRSQLGRRCIRTLNLQRKAMPGRRIISVGRRWGEQTVPAGGVSGGQVPAPSKSVCQAMRPPPRWGWEPARSSEQDSDLFRMDWGSERRCKAGTQADRGVESRRKVSMERRKVWAVTSPLLALEPDPRPAASRRGRVPGSVPAVRLCKVGQQPKETPNPGPLISHLPSPRPPVLLGQHGPLLPPSGHCPLHRSSVPFPSLLGRT